MQFSGKWYVYFCLQEFLREARIMSGLDHPCIVRLIGVCLGPPLILVSDHLLQKLLIDTFVTQLGRLLDLPNNGCMGGWVPGQCVKIGDAHRLT